MDSIKDAKTERELEAAMWETGIEAWRAETLKLEVGWSAPHLN